MAKESLAIKQNVSGSFFVDNTCIDCGTCYWMAPDVFKDVGDQSAVVAQPASRKSVENSLAAIVACPVGSIGTREHKKDLKAAIQSFPRKMAEGVYHCGFHSEASFGAASYFVKSSEACFMVDSPRYVASLLLNMEKLGNPTHMLLSHIDDVADHEKFQKHFQLIRTIHREDLRPKLGEIEEVFEDFESRELFPELEVIPVPGHTRGSVCYLYKKKYLFTGDHLAWDRENKRLKAFHSACWYSWREQIESMKKLLDYSFEWVLPGHGSPINLPATEMRKSLQACIKWMQTF